MTQQEQNKKVVQAYVEAFNKGNLNELRALFSPEAEIQGVFGKAPIEKAVPVWEQLVTSLGMQLIVEDMIAEGDVVAVRYIEHGTFKGFFNGE